LSQARDLTMELFFKNNINQYGKETYDRFLEAYKELEKNHRS
jgi:hypothetical protein